MAEKRSWGTRIRQREDQLSIEDREGHEKWPISAAADPDKRAPRAPRGGLPGSEGARGISGRRAGTHHRSLRPISTRSFAYPRPNPRKRHLCPGSSVPAQNQSPCQTGRSSSCGAGDPRSGRPNLFIRPGPPSRGPRDDPGQVERSRPRPRPWSRFRHFHPSARLRSPLPGARSMRGCEPSAPEHRRSRR